MVAELRPDVVTCDLNMPEMDGLGFVRTQMAIRPVPILIISIATGSGEQVLAALDAGAVDFLQKPTALATDRLLEISEELIEKVKAAAHAAPMRALVALDAVSPLTSDEPHVNATRTSIVVIGASTGGPQALKAVLARLPATCPVPVALVLHMPLGYTEMYAVKLDELSPLTVVESRGGEAVVPGMAFLAPAGRHLVFSREPSGEVLTRLALHPLDTPHRPSVDVLFQSAAEVFGAGVLGVVMTGMGSDGRDGAAWIKAKGGRVITESQDSCVVYGMPRAVVEAGLSDRSVPLDAVARTIMGLL
jgi:two-component system, chemotaxis family, protein-glutamate methylesterase/glutaminase